MKLKTPSVFEATAPAVALPDAPEEGPEEREGEERPEAVVGEVFDPAPGGEAATIRPDAALQLEHLPGPDVCPPSPREVLPATMVGRNGGTLDRGPRRRGPSATTRLRAKIMARALRVVGQPGEIDKVLTSLLKDSYSPQVNAKDRATAARTLLDFLGKDSLRERVAMGEGQPAAAAVATYIFAVDPVAARRLG